MVQKGNVQVTDTRSEKFNQKDHLGCMLISLELCCDSLLDQSEAFRVFDRKIKMQSLVVLWYLLINSYLDSHIQEFFL